MDLSRLYNAPGKRFIIECCHSERSEESLYPEECIAMVMFRRV